MRRICLTILTSVLLCSVTTFAEAGNMVTSDLWIRAVINTEEKGPIEAVWQKGGEDTTTAGDRVIWGHFYADPADVMWGSANNPDLFAKIWFDHSGRLDVNFFHVSVPDIEVYSDYPYDGTPDEHGTTTMERRYIRQYYQNGQSHLEENYEDGVPVAGYSQTGDPSGYSTINSLRIGSMINTVEKGPIDAVWHLGGQDTTARGDQVVWGHFYASPSDVTWGSQDNPDLFIKIWFDVSGRVDVNFFHVSVPDIEVYSDYPGDGFHDQRGTTIMADRYIRHEYWRHSTADYSGMYYITIASERALVMNINQSDNDVVFSMVREIDRDDVEFEGTGTVTDNTINLIAEGNSQISISISFSDDGQSFSGTFELTGVDYPAVGTITGNKEKWETYDVHVNRIPEFVTADCIEVDKIGRVSKFRSGAGHDYSDDFESCRSMKHYYEPKSGVDFSSVRLFSPVDGTIIGTTEEFEGSLSKGTLVGVQVEGYPTFIAHLYHIDLATPLAIGDAVIAGQELGTSAKDDGTAFDMAVGVNTPNGYKLLSFFDVMTDSVFAGYEARGMISRADAIISKEERDVDPLSPCDGSEFVDRGTLENYVTLSD